jgi:alpha-tubulin suppressor-like RCC1 family protein
VYVWGNNAYGRIGNGASSGSIASPYTPTFYNSSIVAVNETFIDVTCGMYHSMALNKAGQVYTWGGSSTAVLARTTSPPYIPVRVTDVLSLKRVVGIAATSDSSTVLCDDGTIFSWGLNTAGELADGTTTQRTLPYNGPKSLNGLPLTVLQSGFQTTYVSLADGSLFAWGSNTNGEIGIGSTINQTNPVNVTQQYPVASYAAGYYNVFTFNTVSNATSAYSVGRNVQGQLGIGNQTTRSTFAQVANSIPWRYASSSAPGTAHTVFLYHAVSCFNILFDDPTVCSGRGNCTAQDTCVCIPAYFSPDCSTKICYGFNSSDPMTCSGHGSCLAYNTCACRQGYTGDDCEIPTSGYLFATGDDSYSQLGDKGLTYNQKFKQMPLFTSISFSFIVSGYGVTIFRNNATSQYYGLGTNRWGVLSSSNVFVNNSINLPTQILMGRDITSLCLGSQHAMHTDSNGAVYAWGTNNFYQLGSGNQVSNYNPTRVNGLLVNDSITVISCGAFHSVAVSLQTGKIYSWGYNLYGQAGDNTYGVGSFKPLPTAATGILSDSFIISASAGAYHTMALDSSGTVYTWGQNTYGQLGDGSNTDRYLPIRVAGSLNGRVIKTVSAGAYFSSVLTDASTRPVYTWGANANGLLLF